MEGLVFCPLRAYSKKPKQNKGLRVSGIRVTRHHAPSRLDVDSNGYVLAYRDSINPKFPRGYWGRSSPDTIRMNPSEYPYWIPMCDLALLPFHSEIQENAAREYRPLCPADSTG